MHGHYDVSKIRIKFDGSFLNRFPPTILCADIVNVYIVYEITSDYKDIKKNCLFGSVKLTKNAVSINMDILDMVLDLIEKHLFRLAMKLVKM